MRFYEIEVFYHAHMVPGMVAFIEVFQPMTGIIPALIAEPQHSFTKQVAMLFHKCAILAPWQTAFAVSLVEPLVVQGIFHRQVADADTAVHSTRGNEHFFHFQLPPNVSNVL